MFLALFSKSYCQRKPGCYSKSTNGGWGGREYQQNPFRDPKRALRQFLAVSNIYFYNQLLCLVLAKIAPIRSIGSVWRKIRYVWVEISGVRWVFTQGKQRKVGKIWYFIYLPTYVSIYISFSIYFPSLTIIFLKK